MALKQDQAQANREKKAATSGFGLAPPVESKLARIAALPYGPKGFGLFCEVLGLKLYAYERRILADYFRGALETVCIIPKKNGKSTLLAALALYHVYKVADARCYIGASSRDQATLIFWQAEQLVNNAGLEVVFDVKGGYRHIRCGSSVVRVLAGDARTADGAEPTLALVDELHRHRNGDLYDVLLNGMRGAGKGQMVTISTAGSTMDSALGRLRSVAYEYPNRTRKGAYTYVRSPSGTFALHEWALADDEDYEDVKVVKRANPAPWITPRTLQAFHDSPSMSLGTWLRFACGIWTEGDEPPIPPQMWDAATGPVSIEEGEPVWAGVALGVRLQHSAVALVREVGSGYVTKVKLFEQPTYAELEQWCRELATSFDLQGLVYTSRGFQRSADLLEEEGLRVVELPQTPERMGEASATFWKLLQEGKLVHDGDKGLRSHVMAARSKETERGWRFVADPTNPRPVAGLFAILAALHVSITEEPPPFVGVGWL